MGKIPLFIHCPVSESVSQAFPAVEESGSFHFHQLKLDSDLFALMIEARPCVAVFSIPDAASRQEVCALLESFRYLRESLGYPKRDPSLRTILVAEEKAVSLERWHDLGVHEFIIAPILPRALAYKIARHHQRAVASTVPEPYAEPDDVIVVRSSGRPEREEKPYGQGPREREVPLSEVTNAARGIRSFVGEKTETPSKYTMITSIPELKEEEGHWEPAAERPEKPLPGEEPRWNWTWNRAGAKKSSWNFRGERPAYDRKRGAWKLSGKKPLLETGKDGAPGLPGLKEKLIDSVDTEQGREIVVHAPADPRTRAPDRRDEPIDVLEVRQGVQRTSGPGPAPGNAGERAGAHRDRSSESADPAEPGSRTRNAPQGRESPAGEDDLVGRAAQDASTENEDPRKPGWTQHVSQSQRSLERMLMTEPDRLPDAWRANPDSSPESPEEELPPELAEISKKLMGDPEPEEETAPLPERERASSLKAKTPAPPESREKPLSENPEAASGPAATRESEIPENLFPDDPSESSLENEPTNPYLDARGPSGLQSEKPGSSPVLGGNPTSAGTRNLLTPRPKASEDPAGKDPGQPETPLPSSEAEDLAALESSKLERAYHASTKSGTFRSGTENSIRLGSSAEQEDPGSMKVLSKDSDPNTWSMQNLDEQPGRSPRKKTDDAETAAGAGANAGEGEAVAGGSIGGADGGEPGAHLFKTGEIPSLDPIIAQKKAELEAAIREGKIPEWLIQMPENAGQDKAWFNRFWKRIQALLRLIGK